VQVSPPASVIRDLPGRIRDDRTQDVWIAVVALETALARLDDVGRRRDRDSYWRVVAFR
jgi:hypothetical protein